MFTQNYVRLCSREKGVRKAGLWRQWFINNWVDQPILSVSDVSDGRCRRSYKHSNCLCVTVYTAVQQSIEPLDSDLDLESDQEQNLWESQGSRSLSVWFASSNLQTCLAKQTPLLHTNAVKSGQATVEVYDLMLSVESNCLRSNWLLVDVFWRTCTA